MSDTFEIGGFKLKSRLFVGTGKLSDYSLIPKIVQQARVNVVTVAVRRLNLKAKHPNIIQYIPENVIIMVNTSGARNSEEAVKIAEIGCEIANSNWVKVEIETDVKYLLPDNEETIKATRILAKKGYKVFPYITPDLIAARKLLNAGATAIMPLGSFIGSNKGIKTKELILPIIEELNIPVIIDAGIGTPSHAAMAMEMGCDAVLVNTAIAISSNPVKMAIAFAKSVEAGRLAYKLGLPLPNAKAKASSPLENFIENA